MIEALARSADFRRLRRHGRRVRHDAMTLTALLDPSLDRPRVAYSVPRGFGPAVRRNRARRRLRALCRDRGRRDLMAPGLYLFSPSDAVIDLDHSELSVAFDEVLQRVSSP